MYENIQIFDLIPPATSTSPNKIVIQGFNYELCRDFHKWMGHDILIDAITKTSKALPKGSEKITIGLVKIPEDMLLESEAVLSKFGDPEYITFKWFPRIIEPDLLEIMSYKLCMMARRAEPFGMDGLQGFCCGNVMLTSERSQAASVIRGLTEDSDVFMGEISSTCTSINVWEVQGS